MDEKLIRETLHDMEEAVFSSRDLPDGYPECVAEIRRRVEAGAAPDLAALVSRLGLGWDDHLEIGVTVPIGTPCCNEPGGFWASTHLCRREPAYATAPTLAACLEKLCAEMGRGEGT